MTNYMRYISTCTRPIANKYGKVVIYCKGLPSTKSNDLLNKWSREVKWQIEYVISLLTVRRFYPRSHMVLKPRGLARHLHKLKPFYIDFHSAYGHQLEEVFTHLERLQPIKSHKPLITWSLSQNEYPIYTYKHQWHFQFPKWT